MRMQGTVAMQRSFAAWTRQWPARMVCSASISTGLVKPKVRMLSATCRICFLEWVRALRAHGRRREAAICSMAWAEEECFNLPANV
jgi:hypothetical protein